MFDQSAQNLELKVRLAPAELADRRSVVIAESSCPLQALRHVDTYFRVASGRLKLREIQQADGATAELIAYHRPDHAGTRWSTYDRVTIVPGEVRALKRGLLATLGELITVAKSREIGIIGHSRIHFDTVRNLGTFLEIETVVADQDPATAAVEMAALVARLRLAELPPIGESYSDLLLAHRAGAANGSRKEHV